MNTNIEDIDIAYKFKQLNLNIPEGLVFFPENLETTESVDEFIFAEPLTELRKVFRAKNLKFSILGTDTVKLRVRKSSDIYLPSLFIGVSLLSENQTMASLAISVLANYVTDFLRGIAVNKSVHLDIYVQKTYKKKITKISYNGSVEGLKNLDNIIKQVK